MRRPEEEEPSRTWEGPVLTAAVLVGLLLMAVQLWLLTVALDLLLGGKTHGFLGLTLASGAVFAGGLFVLWLMRGPARAERARR